jgi:hypothetical protein
MQQKVNFSVVATLRAQFCDPQEKQVVKERVGLDDEFFVDRGSPKGS